MTTRTPTPTLGAMLTLSQVKRLMRMSPHEVLVRMTERAWGVHERILPPTPPPWSAEESAAILRRAALRPFYSRGAQDSADALRENFRAQFSSVVARIVERADAICRGTLRLFGQNIPYAPRQLDWHRDWILGETSARIFYRRIREFDTPHSADFRRVWELNRHQFLVTLGQAYFLTGRLSYSEYAMSLLDSWIDSNPPYQGLNWMEALEPALRIVSWIWTLQLLDGAPGFSPQRLHRILTSLWHQRVFIERHLSIYSSPNTHLLGEALGLFLAGLCFPELPGSRRAADRGLRLLEEELRRQVFDDGCHRERSAYYHAYALEMYLLSTIIGRQYGIEFSAGWDNRVEKMAEAQLAIVCPDGSLARFGDDDGGKTLRLDRENLYQPIDLLAVAAVLFNRPDLRPTTHELPSEIWWLLGPEGIKGFAKLGEKRSADRTTLFPQAKLFVLRSGWDRDDLWLCGQADPVDSLLPGHGHAGLLSFELFARERPWIVDPGTYTYDWRTKWRDHFRRAGSHNSVQIDAEEHLSPAGPFRWKTAPLEPSLERCEHSNALKIGYRAIRRGRGPLGHFRIVRLLPNGSVSVSDQFEGVGSHRLTFRLPFAPGCSIRQTGPEHFEVAAEGSILYMVLVGFGPFQWKVLEGSEEPPAGWYSPRFDEKVPSPVLVWDDETVFPAQREFRISFQPARPGTIPVIVSATRGSQGTRKE